MRGKHSSRKTRTREQCLAGNLERCDGLFAGHGGKVREEVVQAVAGFKVIDQVLHRHARTDEDRRAAKDLGVGLQYLLGFSHEFLIVIVLSLCSKSRMMTTETLTVRPIRYDEIALLAAAVPDELTPEHVENRWGEQQLGYRELLVAALDGELVGTVSLRESSLDGHSLHLFALEVTPARRSQGIGSAIVEHVVAEARRRGCERVYLEVRVDSAARRLYHRLGFRRVGASFLNAWWQYGANSSRQRVEELTYRMVKRLRP